MLRVTSYIHWTTNHHQGTIIILCMQLPIFILNLHIIP